MTLGQLQTFIDNLRMRGLAHENTEIVALFKSEVREVDFVLSAEDRKLYVIEA